MCNLIVQCCPIMSNADVYLFIFVLQLPCIIWLLIKKPKRWSIEWCFNWVSLCTFYFLMQYSNLKIHLIKKLSNHNPRKVFKYDEFCFPEILEKIHKWNDKESGRKIQNWCPLQKQLYIEFGFSWLLGCQRRLKGWENLNE